MPSHARLSLFLLSSFSLRSPRFLLRLRDGFFTTIYLLYLWKKRGSSQCPLNLLFAGVAHIHTPGFIKRIQARGDVQVKWGRDPDPACGAECRATELGAQVAPALDTPPGRSRPSWWPLSSAPKRTAMRRW